MSYQCQHCKNLLSYEDYVLHNKYCSLVPMPQYTTQPYNTTIGTNSTANYLNNYNINNQTAYISNNNIRNINPNNHTIYVDNNTVNKNNVISNIKNNPNVTIIQQQKQPVIQTQTQYFIPQTTVYYNTTPYQNYNYTNNLQTKPKTYPVTQTIPTTIKNNVSNNVTFKCNICGETMSESTKNDHLLSHKLEQEEKDLLQAKRLQDEDLFNNLSPEQIEEQRRIEEQIRRQNQNNYRINNNNNLNNMITNDFNIDDDMNMNIPNIGNIRGMNTNGIPNVIIRRTTNNNGINNIETISSGMGSPGFFDNFFNGRGMMNIGMGNMPNVGNRGNRLIIPMGMMGNMGGNMMGQNDLNELIERMLHYTRENPTDAAIVSELPETKIDDIKKLDNDKKNCVICMEDFKNGDVTTNLPCLHMFHTNCIQSWLKTQNTCPICKFKLTQDNINNINRSGS